MIIDKTEQEIVGIDNLHTGVYRIMNGILSGMIFYYSPQIPDHNKVHTNGQGISAFVHPGYVLGEGGGIGLPLKEYDWSVISFKRIANTIDFVIPGQKG